MKDDVMPSIVQMEKDVLQRLVKEVKETVAANFNPTPKKEQKDEIKAIDFWGIRRNRRPAASFLRRGPIRVY